MTAEKERIYKSGDRVQDENDLPGTVLKVNTIGVLVRWDDFPGAPVYCTPSEVRPLEETAVQVEA